MIYVFLNIISGLWWDSKSFPLKLIKSFSLFVLRIVLFCPRLTAFLSVGRHLLIQSWTHQLTISQVGWRHSISASVKCFHFMLILRVSNHTFLSKLSGIMFPKVPFQVFLHSGVEMFFIFLHLVWSGFGLIIISIFLNWNWIQSHVIQAFNNFRCILFQIEALRFNSVNMGPWMCTGESFYHRQIIIMC